MSHPQGAYGEDGIQTNREAPCAWYNWCGHPARGAPSVGL